MRTGWVYSGTTENDVYYGSSYTKKGIKNRWYNHKAHYNSWLRGDDPTCTSILLYINDIEPSWEVLETYEFETKKELKDKLKERESYFIKNFDCVNKFIPNQTAKESKANYYKNNKEKVNKNNANYRKNNKEKIIEKRKEPYFCEACNTTIRTCGKSRHFKSKKHIDNM